MFKDTNATWGKMVVLPPGSDVASALWLRHRGLAQDPCVLLLPLCFRACLSASIYEKVLGFIGISSVLRHMWYKVRFFFTLLKTVI